MRDRARPARGRGHLFRERWPPARSAPTLIRNYVNALGQKAAVSPGTPIDGSWALPLVPSPIAEPLLLLVQQESLLGRVPGFRRAPFNAAIPTQTTTANFSWIAPNALKPILKYTFDTLRLGVGKVGGIVVLTEELARLSAPNGEGAMRDALVGDIVTFQDSQLLDPAVAEVANVSPGSLTNGVTPTVAAAPLAEQIAAVLAALAASRPGAARPTLIMSPAVAGQLGNDVRVDGGVAYFGVVPIVTSPGAGAT